ncbi:MAG: hypothetical protein HYV95_12675 [Opitutae bacterium]|nr:hypothetical protein [Opitutae bacterium]
MSSPDDASPKTIDGIIDINVHEESAVFEILKELKQRFPHEGAETLRQRTQEKIAEKARSGVVGFFRRKWPAQIITDISAEEGIERLSRPETWVENWDDQLVAYEKEPNQKD